MDTILTRLKLAGIRQTYRDWLERAAREDLGHADFLQALLQEELAAREASQLQRRTRQASLPYLWTIEQFDFTCRPELKRQVVFRYLDPNFIQAATTLVFIGPPGLGKTHLSVAIAVKMLQLGFTVRFLTAQALATQVLRCRDVEARQRLLKPLLTVDLLVLDELGYLVLDPRVGPVLYELIAGRYEHTPTIITTNKTLSEWGGIFQDPSLAAAFLDRLLHHGGIYHFKGPSYRLRGKTLVEGAPTSPSPPEPRGTPRPGKEASTPAS